MNGGCRDLRIVQRPHGEVLKSAATSLDPQCVSSRCGVFECKD